MTYRLAFDRWLDTPVDSNDEQHHHQHGACDEQTRSSTEGVGNEDEEHEAGNRLDNAVDSRGKQGRVRSRHSEIGEDLRSVIVLQVMSEGLA